MKATRALARATLEQARIHQSARIIRELIPDSDQRALYFYWGRGASESLPYLRRLFGAGLAVVRLHGYDLYEARSPSGYLPYRSWTWSADWLVPVSDDGARHLVARDPRLKRRISVRRLGSPTAARQTPGSSDGYLRVASCSTLRPVKRVWEIPRLLQATGLDHIEWTHFGDGPDRPRVEAALAQCSSVTGHLLGNVPSSEIMERYATGTFDAFMNVSVSEGVPVSIMEALAAGIPVIATDVGGTCELVDEQVGGLIPPDLPADLTVELLRNLLDPAVREMKSRAAVARHAALCDENRLASELIEQVFEASASRTQPRCRSTTRANDA